CYRMMKMWETIAFYFPTWKVFIQAFILLVIPYSTATPYNPNIACSYVFRRDIRVIWSCFIFPLYMQSYCKA
ncbi:TPA: hypothetical protein ACTZ5A_005419, partial [Bacillus cereus]